MSASNQHLKTILDHFAHDDPEPYISKERWKNYQEIEKKMLIEVIKTANRAAVRATSASIARLAATSINLEQENQALKNQLKNQAVLESQLQVLTVDLSQKKSELSTVKKRNEALEAIISQQNRRILQLENEKNLLEKNLQISIEERTRNAAEIAQLRIDYTNKIQECELEQQKRLKTQNELTSSKRELEKLSDIITHLNQNNARLHEENVQLKTLVKELQVELQIKLNIINNQQLEIKHFQEEQIKFKTEKAAFDFRVIELQHKKENLENQLKNTEKLAQADTVSFNQLKNEHVLLMAELKKASNGEKSLEEALQKNTILLKDLTSKLDVSQQALEKTLQEKKEAITELKDTQTKVVELEVKLQAEALKDQATKKKVVTLKNEILNLTSDVEQINAKNEELSKQLITLNSHHENEKNALKSASQEEKKAFENKKKLEIEALDVLLQEKGRQTTYLDRELSEKVSLLKIANQKAIEQAQLTQQLTTGLSQKQQQIVQLENNFKSVKLENEELEKSLRQQKDLVQNQLLKIDQLSNENATISIQLHHAEGQRKIIEIKNNNLKNDYSHLQEELIAKENLVSSLKATSANLVNTLTHTQAEKLKTQEALHATHAMLTKTKEEIEQKTLLQNSLEKELLKTQILEKQQALKTEALRERVTHLTEEITQYQTQIKTLDEKLNNKNLMISEQESALAALKNQNNILNDRLSIANQSIQIAEKALIDKQKDSERFKDALEKANENQQIYTTLLETEKKKTHQLKLRIQDQALKVSTLETALSENISERDEALKKVESLAIELNQWQHKYQLEKSKRKEAEEKLERANQTIAEQAKTVLESQQKIERITESLHLVNTKLMEAQKTKTQDEKSIKLLRKQKKSLLQKCEAQNQLMQHSESAMKELKEKLNQQASDSDFWQELNEMNMEMANQIYNINQQYYTTRHHKTQSNLLHAYGSQKKQTDWHNLLDKSTNSYNEMLEITMELIEADDPQIANLLLDETTQSFSLAKNMLLIHTKPMQSVSEKNEEMKIEHKYPPKIQ